MTALCSCGDLKPVFVTGNDKRMSKVHRWRKDNAQIAAMRCWSTRNLDGVIKAFGRSLEVLS